MEDKPILQVRDLHFSFSTYGGTVKAVRGVSFDLRPGEILGIVGESGCGKSVTAQSILKLNPQPPGFFEGGSILYKGEDLTGKSERQMRRFRGKEIGFIFQDPMTSLNPTMKIGKQLEEIFVGRADVKASQARERALEILRRVGLSDPERRLEQYPHELSGGMKQRVMIAIALIGRPGVVIADEPTTSLDVTTEAQILSLLKELSAETHSSVILITHDLGVIAKLCDHVITMYGGKMVERGTVEDIFYRTGHPYTAGLLRSIARLDTKKGEKLRPIEGSPPDLFSPPPGCPFAARCEYCMQICLERMPKEYPLGERHGACCWLKEKEAPNADLTFRSSGTVSVPEPAAAPQAPGTEPLVRVEGLSKYFQLSRRETLKAVDGVSFGVYPGETLGVVGESGCGKSTLGRCLVRLYRPTKGRVLLEGKDIFSLGSKREERKFCKDVQMIFQNPYASLNPRMTVREIVGEGMKMHSGGTPAELDDRIEQLLHKVGLNREHMSRFAHEFSGGQKQRIGIARALSVGPKFIVCDEPISALDVSIQAQIINMLKNLQEEMGLTYLFIAHDLSVVKYISDRIIVMYLGSVVEQASAEELYRNPLHPYTRALLSSIPVADPRAARKETVPGIRGEVPSPINPKPGCRFAERCPFAKPECREAVPRLREVAPGHWAACALLD